MEPRDIWKRKNGITSCFACFSVSTNRDWAYIPEPEDFSAELWGIMPAREVNIEQYEWARNYFEWYFEFQTHSGHFFLSLCNGISLRVLVLKKQPATSQWNRSPYTKVLSDPKLQENWIDFTCLPGSSSVLVMACSCPTWSSPVPSRTASTVDCSLQVKSR